MRKKILLCHDTGTGKTLTSILWANKVAENNVLVIVPKALRENWRRNLHQYSTKDWIVYTKEEFRTMWATVRDYDAIIVDEAHYFAGMKSQMHKNLMKYLKKYRTENVLLATATPYLSTPWNIYAIAALLGHEWSYSRFQAKFFTQQHFHKRIVWTPKAGCKDEIATLVAKLGDIVHIEECADIPDQTFETELFSLNSAQEKAKEEVEEFNPVVLFTKHHQIENGTLKGEKGYTDDLFIQSDKADRVVELAQTNKKVAIVCRYNLQINLYVSLLEKKVKKNIYVIQGKTKNRDAVVQQVEQEKECVVLINAACSEGYELPSVGLCVFASLSFSYKDYKQMLGRFLRINKLKKNVYLHLVTKGGIDESVYKSIMNKQDFDIAIYAEKNRP